MRDKSDTDYNIYRFRYELSMSLHVNERTVYSILDYLGDIGGFVDALSIIANMLLFLISF